MSLFRYFEVFAASLGAGLTVGAIGGCVCWQSPDKTWHCDAIAASEDQNPSTSADSTTAALTTETTTGMTDTTMDMGPSSDAVTSDTGSTQTTEIETETTASATTTMAVCQNGIVEGDEVCDEGVYEGGYNKCGLDCSGYESYCGDGVHQEGNLEECDDGNAMSDDGCIITCEKADDPRTCTCIEAKCGDGYLALNESCDDGNTMDGDKCPAACRYWTVFVTAAVFTGKIESRGLTGLLAADDACQTEADAEGLRGTYKAWLSSSAADGSAGVRLGLSGPESAQIPFQATNGGSVAENWSDLTDGMLSFPVIFTGNGRSLGGMPEVWTNTGPDGKAAQKGLVNTCGDWTSSDGQAAFGLASKLDLNWTLAQYGGCLSPKALYCFQVSLP